MTPIIDREYALNQVLGERFLLYRVPVPSPEDVARRALTQSDATQHRRRIREMVAAVVRDLPTTEAPDIPPEIHDALVALAVLAAQARSPVFFDHRGEIDFVPPPESPGRIAKQLGLLAQALAIVRGQPRVDEHAYATVARVASDTMPAQRRTMLTAVLKPPTQKSTTTIAEATGYPTVTTRRYLQELTALDLVTRIPDGAGKPDQWAPSESLIDRLQASDPGNLFSCVRREVVKSES